MKKVGIIGFRGMVGSVLLERMHECGDFNDIDAAFYSTSLKGEKAPVGASLRDIILDSNDLDSLMEEDFLLVCQGGDYTKAIHPKLRKNGWNGVWIDAASTLRMDEKSFIVLDPVNKERMLDYYHKGGRDFIGSNCTVALLLLAIKGLIDSNQVEWVSAMTYQSASGAGKAQLQELMKQSQFTAGIDSNGDALLDEKNWREIFLSQKFPTESWGGIPLHTSVLPWIDSEVENGMSREEWKGMVEANKILAKKENNPLKLDGLCVRVPVLRCHSQALTIKLKEVVNLNEIEEALQDSHEWLRYVPNCKQESLEKLTPISVSGTLDIAVGRLRQSRIDKNMIHLFTVGDQLLWGAAEPIRRTLQIMKQY